MAHWLFKSEPITWSWQQQLAKGEPEQWHGVRNYAARNNMRAMKLGDEGFFYHSVQEKQIMGIVRVVALAHPDSTAHQPGDKVVWECVDIEAVKPLPRPVTLDEIKQVPELANMVLINNSRLSVQPVTDEEWSIICQLGGL
jgi:predicted RNA-binding protein with PUA-like domain